MTIVSSCSIKEETKVEKRYYPTFYATMETSDDYSDTKAYVNGDKLGFWNKNDNLSIFYGNTYNKKYYYEGPSGTTSGEFKPVNSSDGLNAGVDFEGFDYAIYPYDPYNACQTDGTLIVPFPKERTFSSKGNDDLGASIMLVARTETDRLPFKHVAGYLGFNLYGEGISVASITLKSNNNEPFSGSADVKYDADGKLVVTFTDRDNEDDPTTTMYYDPPIALNASSEESKMFWITLPPTQLAEGLTIIVKDANGGIWEKSSSSLDKIEQNKFKPFNPMEVETVMPDIQVESVSIEPAELNLKVGYESSLRATVSPVNAIDKSLTWSSSNDNIVTVEDGVVKALSVGKASITATSVNGKTATCLVTVADNITYEGLEITPVEAMIKIGGTQEYTVTLKKTVNGEPITENLTGLTLTFVGEDEDVASAEGYLVTGLKKGETKVKVEYTPEGSDKLTAEAKLTVSDKNPNEAGDPIGVDPDENF